MLVLLCWHISHHGAGQIIWPIKYMTLPCLEVSYFLQNNLICAGPTLKYVMTQIFNWRENVNKDLFLESFGLYIYETLYKKLLTWTFYQCCEVSFRYASKTKSNKLEAMQEKNCKCHRASLLSFSATNLFFRAIFLQS